MPSEFRWRRVLGLSDSPSRHGLSACTGHETVTIGHLAYIFFGGNDGLINQICIFDISKQEWIPSIPTFHGELPKCVASFGLAKLDHLIYIFGGVRDDRTFSNEMYELNTKRRAWRKIRSNESTFDGRAGQSLIGHKDRLYMFGGRTSSSKWTNDFLCYEDKKWTKVDSIGHTPSPRDNHTCVLYEYQISSPVIIVFGGFDGLKRLNDLFIYGIEQKTWISVDYQLPVVPSPRSSHSAAIIGGQMIVFGGYTHSIPGQPKCCNRTYSFNPDTRIWKRINNTFDGEVPCRRAGHVSFSFCNRMFIVNGRSKDRCLEDVWSLDTALPCNPKNVTIVSLSEYRSQVSIQWSCHGCSDFYLVQIKRLQKLFQRYDGRESKTSSIRAIRRQSEGAHSSTDIDGDHSRDEMHYSRTISRYQPNSLVQFDGPVDSADCEGTIGLPSLIVEDWVDVGVFKSNACVFVGYPKKPLHVQNSIDFNFDSHNGANNNTELHALRPNAIYHVRVIGVNTIGLSSPSAQTKFHTFAFRSIDTPSNLRAFQFVNEKKVRCEWDAVYPNSPQNIIYALYVGIPKDANTFTFTLVYSGFENNCQFKFSKQWLDEHASLRVRLMYKRGTRFGPVIESSIRLFKF